MPFRHNYGHDLSIHCKSLLKWFCCYFEAVKSYSWNHHTKLFYHVVDNSIRVVLLYVPDLSPRHPRWLGQDDFLKFSPNRNRWFVANELLTWHKEWRYFMYLIYLLVIQHDWVRIVFCQNGNQLLTWHKEWRNPEKVDKPRRQLSQQC